MSAIDELVDKLKRLQDFAAAYFDLLYQTVLLFWLLPEVPPGANILSSAFAIILLYLARHELGQPLESDTLLAIVGSTFLILLILCGISLALDNKLREPSTTGASAPNFAVVNYRKLISVVCVGIIFGNACIVLGYLPPHWVDHVYNWQSNAPAANLAVCVVSAILTSLILVVITLGRLGRNAFSSARNMAWAIWICVLIGLGIHLTVGRPEPFWE
jgi:hypothetical protein